MLVGKWFAVLFVILTTVNKLFSFTHLFKNIYKHIAWYTKGKVVVIVYLHGHMTITVLLVHDCVGQTKAHSFALLWHLCTLIVWWPKKNLEENSIQYIHTKVINHTCWLYSIDRSYSSYWYIISATTFYDWINFSRYLSRRIIFSK